MLFDGDGSVPIKLTIGWGRQAAIAIASAVHFPPDNRLIAAASSRQSGRAVNVTTTAMIGSHELIERLRAPDG